MTLSQRAQSARQELFAGYDQLNALWLAAEERLTKHHIPRPVCYPYNSEPMFPEQGERSPRVYHCLGLQKVKGKWRICVGYGHDEDDSGPSDWTPIVDCSAEVRVEAASHLPGLEQEAVESAEGFIPKVKEAIQSLSEALGRPDNLAELLAERAKLNGKAE